MNAAALTHVGLHLDGAELLFDLRISLHRDGQGPGGPGRAAGQRIGRVRGKGGSLRLRQTLISGAVELLAK